ncbi:MAG: NADPH:quinone oxidoreductase family protein, partial [Solirubrobacteraceae bacterium]|nr:NADPH:quinone oxidoreductase family protein [Patulibacter sp.]
DLLLSRGEYQIKLEPPFTLGVEAAGRVAQAPEGSGLEVGQRVAAFGLGMAAERVAAAPEMVLPIPDGLTDAQGAALIMNYHTAHFALLHRGRLGAGDTALIHGAAGGVGTAAIQVAKGAGARTIAVVSSDEKEQVAHDAGADEVIRPEEGWPKQVKALTGGAGVDVILDPVGGDRVTDSLRSLAVEGRLVVVGFTGGAIPTVALNRLLLKNISVVGAAWGAFVGLRPDVTRAIHADLLAWAEQGIVAPIIGRTYAMEDGAQALRDLDERRATGKLVVEVGR